MCATQRGQSHKGSVRRKIRSFQNYVPVKVDFVLMIVCFLGERLVKGCFNLMLFLKKWMKSVRKNLLENRHVE